MASACSAVANVSHGEEDSARITQRQYHLALAVVDGVSGPGHIPVEELVTASSDLIKCLTVFPKATLSIVYNTKTLAKAVLEREMRDLEDRISDHQDYRDFLLVCLKLRRGKGLREVQASVLEDRYRENELSIQGLSSVANACKADHHRFLLEIEALARAMEKACVPIPAQPGLSPPYRPEA